jgi:hypothetical protein
MEVNTMKRKLPIAVLAAVMSIGVMAPSANAGVTTYWPSVVQSACNGVNVASVPSYSYKYRGNFGYNRVWSQLYVNGGNWWWGADYIAPLGAKMVNNSQVGSWNSITSIDGTVQSNPFINNNNAVNVGASGCFYW